LILCQQNDEEVITIEPLKFKLFRIMESNSDGVSTKVKLDIVTMVLFGIMEAEKIGPINLSV
jgi:hypothetical protein